MTEIWKDIEGYDGRYQVSNKGRVRSDRKVLSPGKRKTGYCFVVLYGAEQKKTATVHRLVAKAFILNPNNYPEVDHINGDPSDNRVENLRWCTHGQNNSFPLKRKRVSNSMKASSICRRRILDMNAKKRRPVRCVDTEEVYESITSAARSLNVSPGMIFQAIKLGHRCRGKSFEYVEKSGALGDTDAFEK